MPTQHDNTPLADLAPAVAAGECPQISTVTTVTLPARAVLAAAIVAGDPRRQVPSPDGDYLPDPHIALLPAAGGGTLIVGSRGTCCYVEHVSVATLEDQVVFRVPTAAMAALYDCDQPAELTLVRPNGTPGRAHLTIIGPAPDGIETVTCNTETRPLRAGGDEQFGELFDLLHDLEAAPASRISPLALAPLLEVAQICAGPRRNWESVWRSGDYIVVRWADAAAIGIAIVNGLQFERSDIGLPTWVRIVQPADGGRSTTV